VLGDFLVVDLQALEERLVEQATLFGLGLAVGDLNAIRERERYVKRLDESRVFEIKLLSQPPSRDPFPADALLFLGKEAHADPVGVVRCQELALLVL
jgi:hypothetical protein